MNLNKIYLNRNTWPKRVGGTWRKDERMKDRIRERMKK